MKNKLIHFLTLLNVEIIFFFIFFFFFIYCPTLLFVDTRFVLILIQILILFKTPIIKEKKPTL